MSRLNRRYTLEVLETAVGQATSVAGVLRVLGLPQAGGTHSHISRTIKAFGIDTSHLVRYQGTGRHHRKSPDDILVRSEFGSRRAKPLLLRRALEELGVPNECVLCGNPNMWQGQPLRLEVDHIDGDFHNNLRENLRLLCPNCHSQTPNFSGRSKGKYSAETQPSRRDASTSGPCGITS